MEKKMRITIRCGRNWKEVAFPVPEELEAHLLGLQDKELEEKGSAFRVTGNKNIAVRLEVFGFEKEL